MGTQTDVRVIRSADRGHWWNEWLDSRQSFPATGNFDLAANAHGLLMVHNEDTIQAGEGFDTHQHRDMEIITWVLEGTVVHQDSAGNSGLIYPGLAQRMSAGTGIRHSEKNASNHLQGERVRVVQMWISPDTTGTAPSYEEREVDAGPFVTIASGMAAHRNSSAIRIGNKHAALHVARLDPGQSITIPDAPFGHVFVANGSALFEGYGQVSQGDTVRLTSTGGHRITAAERSEILLWEMHAST
ncbi:pirin family protein [Antrihabitans sp. YC2-6]|uniref:pirin family protein n=1 Tax=Antrihabitans sp. YC2-6 TaxID=2799498 RepID=UPI0018F34231|nr:pirin family protein [Antrihabitans sp. YC2-6]MBJ8345338.1 pirin family protein [Antrihabitans sp. YC2-6]